MRCWHDLGKLKDVECSRILVFVASCFVVCFPPNVISAASVVEADYLAFDRFYAFLLIFCSCLRDLL